MEEKEIGLPPTSFLKVISYFSLFSIIPEWMSLHRWSDKAAIWIWPPQALKAIFWQLLLLLCETPGREISGAVTAAGHEGDKLRTL